MAANEILSLAIGSLTFLKPGEKLILANNVQDEAAFRSLSLYDVECVVRRVLRMREFSPSAILTRAEAVSRYVRSRRIGILTPFDAQYPELLKEIYDPPFLLFFRGEVPAFQKGLLSVVGTRQPTGKGMDAAYRLGFECGMQRIGVASGLARGIDTAAHRGNLDGCGKTVAVLGCGIDRVYPLSNRELARRILERGGAIVSEYYPGVPPLTYHFPERNRIISGLSEGVVIVEAPAKSGALITADYALDQGRELFVHRAGLSGPSSAGSMSLSEDGARVIDTVSDIACELGWPVEPCTSQEIRTSEKEALPEGMELAHELLDELSGSLVSFRGRRFRLRDPGGKKS